jgi:MFS family permease
MQTDTGISTDVAASRASSRVLWLAILAGGVVMGLVLGIRHSQGIFLLPITQDQGWSREAFGFSIAVQNLVWGMAQPITGMIADRFGSRRTIVAGLLFYCLGLLTMSSAATPAAFTLSAGVCIGIGLSGTAFGVIYGALSRIAPPEKRSWALGVAGGVGGLGQFFMVPVSQGLLSGLGWVSALVVLGVLCAVALPLAFPLRDKVAGSTSTVQISLRAALKEAFAHRGFLLLNLGFLVCGFQLSFIGTHLPAYLMDNGLNGNHVVVGLAIIALTNAFGTYYCGWLGGFLRRKYLLASIYLIRSIAIAAFVWTPLSPMSLYLFCAVLGLLWLGTAPLTNGLVSQVFGIQYIATLFGFVFLSHQVGSFIGVWLGGLVFDATKSYDIVWSLTIGLGVLAAIVHIPINDCEILRGKPQCA